MAEILVPNAQGAAVIALTKVQQITTLTGLSIGEVVDINQDGVGVIGTATVVSITPCHFFNLGGTGRMRIYGKEYRGNQRDQFVSLEGYADWDGLVAGVVPNAGDRIDGFVVVWTGFA